MTVEIREAKKRTAPWYTTASWINKENQNFKAKEILEKAQLDWQVVHSPITSTVLTDNGVTTLEIPKKVATTRINKDGTASVLGITSPTYSIVQNDSIVHLVDQVMYESGAIMKSAGELRGGKKIFFAAQLPNNLEITNKNIDPVDTMLIATNTHDGTDALRFKVMHFRQICSNGMHAWTNINSVAFRHTSRMDVTVGNIRKALGVIMKAQEEFNNLSVELINKTISNSEFYNIVKKLLPEDEANMTPRQLENIAARRQALTSIWTGATQENIINTAWGVVNAFSEFEQWGRATRSNQDKERAERFMLNQGNHLTEQALSLVSGLIA